MSSDRPEHASTQALLDEVLDATDLSEGAREDLRNRLTRLLALPAGAPERTSETSPYTDPHSQPTLAPAFEGSAHIAPPVASAREDATGLVAVGLLGRGGMGEVHRARDASLDRHLAMKLLHARLCTDRRMRQRFLAEAVVTAQLAHPGIPPVHQLGESDDGRPFFTMKEVHGRTLGDVVRDTHRPGIPGAWTQSRLLDVFHRVCEAVAYAHSRGVVHCDLKPDNVMVGAFGEVLVMDWGVARVVAPSAAEGRATEPPIRGDWTAALDTESTVAGTPAYMPPEQATGEVAEIGPPADVFALGVILYELLAGVRPFRGDVLRMIRAVRTAAIAPLERRPGSLVDTALERIIHRALAADPRQRFPDAGAMALEFGRWKEGSLRREAALKVVQEAEDILPEVAPLQAQAQSLRERAELLLASLADDAPAQEKGPAWSLLDEASALELQVEMRTTEVTQRLQAALVHAPNLKEARQLLARMHFQHHREAEHRHDRAAAVRHEMLLRERDVGEFAEYLTGTAALSLVTEPPCEVVLHRSDANNRVERLVRVRSLGSTPLRSVELPIGSYVLELCSEDRPTVWYPIQLDRLEDWDQAEPRTRSITPLKLPPDGAVEPDERFVPAGWCRIGGDLLAPGSVREERVWVDSFAVRTLPVTAGELFTFLATGSDPKGRSEVLRATDGLRHPRWPATGAPWATARAFADWVSAQDGRPWRLPTEVEWSKASRGVDSRHFPWGDFADDAFCHVRAGRRLPSLPLAVGGHPVDRSPYGVRDCAGNAREWCLDPYHSEQIASVQGGASCLPDLSDPAVLRSVRGGSWRQPIEWARCTARTGLRPDVGYGDVGFRLVRPL